jgi:hypothetical protein
VGVVQPECVDFVVSGWKDVGNVDGNDGGDCDDMINEVDCECSGDADPTTTKTDPVRVPFIVGNNCYCDTTGNVQYGTTSRRRLGKKGKKGKKSKGKKGSKKKKGKKKGEGLGVGDCDCEGGQTELTMMYSGDATVDIYYYHKDGPLICTTMNVAKGDESVCNVLNYQNGKYSKLGTNTFVELKKAGTQQEACSMSIHTSCSRDIVGTYGNDGHNCGTTMVVSGWKDANNEVSGGECDDGLELCDCASTVLLRQVSGVTVPATGSVQGITQNSVDSCFCSNKTAILAKGDLKFQGQGRGYGKCDCVGGIRKLRFVYLPLDASRAGTAVDIALFADKGYSELICEFANVAPGEENECDVQAQTPKRFFSFPPGGAFTYVQLTDTQDSSSVQEGFIRSGCNNGQDIVGWAANKAPDLVVTGWEDTTGAGDCDDGFYPCGCANCAPFDVSGGASSECAKQEGCFVNEFTGTCDTLSAALFNGSDAPKQVSLLWVAALAVIATFLF